MRYVGFAVGSAPRMLCASLLALLVSVVGCSKETESDGDTQVLVSVDSDLGADLASVEVQLYDEAGEKPGGRHAFDVAKDGLPVSLTVSPSPDKPLGRFLVVGRGKTKAGELLAEAKGLVGFIKGRRLAVSLFLGAGCRNVQCQARETCESVDNAIGVCKPVEMLIAEVLPPDTKPTPDGPVITPPDVTNPTGDAGREVEAGWSDAGSSDAGTSDAGAKEGGPDASVVEAVENVPTVGGFGVLSASRRNAAGAWLYDDGFELGPHSCNAAGLCAVASFAP